MKRMGASEVKSTLPTGRVSANTFTSVRQSDNAGASEAKGTLPTGRVSAIHPLRSEQFDNVWDSAVRSPLIH